MPALWRGCAYVRVGAWSYLFAVSAPAFSFLVKRIAVKVFAVVICLTK